MVRVQMGFAGMNITSKLAIQSGTNPLILVAYRQIFAFLSIAPFAYWLERKTLPRMTGRLMLQTLFSSLTGVANQILYFVGLKYSTATIACVLTNLLPAFTFVLALVFRQTSARSFRLTGYMCFLASFQCCVLIIQPQLGHFIMLQDILFSALYAGIVCTGLVNCLMTWTIERKGPLYVSVFTPLELVLTAILSLALFQEKLYVGTVVGSLLIVYGERAKR